VTTRHVACVWLSDSDRWGIYRLFDPRTGAVVTTVRREGDVEGASGAVARFGRRVAALYVDAEGQVIFQVGKKRFGVEDPLTSVRSSRGRLLHMLRVRHPRVGAVSISYVGLYAALGPLVDWTWDGLDEMAEDRFTPYEDVLTEKDAAGFRQVHTGTWRA